MSNVLFVESETDDDSECHQEGPGYYQDFGNESDISDSENEDDWDKETEAKKKKKKFISSIASWAVLYKISHVAIMA